MCFPHMATLSSPCAADVLFLRPCFACFFGRQNNAKIMPKGTPKITKNHKKSKKEGAERPCKFDTSKNIKNDRFWEGLGPAESCWDSGESVVFTNSPNHEKVLKNAPKSVYLGGPGDTKITKRRKTWTPTKTMIFWVPKTCQKGLIETPQMDVGGVCRTCKSRFRHRRQPLRL